MRIPSPEFSVIAREVLKHYEFHCWAELPARRARENTAIFWRPSHIHVKVGDIQISTTLKVEKQPIQRMKLNGEHFYFIRNVTIWVASAIHRCGIRHDVPLFIMDWQGRFDRTELVALLNMGMADIETFARKSYEFRPPLYLSEEELYNTPQM